MHLTLFEMRPSPVMDRHDRFRLQYIRRFEQTAAVHGIFTKTGKISELRRTDMEDADVDRITRSDLTDAVEEDRVPRNIDDTVLLSNILYDEARRCFPKRIPAATMDDVVLERP
jgi:hypothetical protein